MVQRCQVTLHSDRQPGHYPKWPLSCRMLHPLCQHWSSGTDCFFKCDPTVDTCQEKVLGEYTCWWTLTGGIVVDSIETQKLFQLESCVTAGPWPIMTVDTTCLSPAMFLYLGNPHHSPSPVQLHQQKNLRLLNLLSTRRDDNVVKSPANAKTLFALAATAPTIDLSWGWWWNGGGFPKNV